MSDEDLIAGLQASVKREVVERYVRERRILEEEVAMVLEAASAWHGGLAAWEAMQRRLARALITEEAGRSFFHQSGLGDYPGMARRERRYRRPPAWRQCRAYVKLIAGMYGELVRDWSELKEERERVLSLMAEVNADILHFEANHDMMALSAYLRSLDPQEILRRKILGVNFTAKEQALSAEALSYRPVAAERLALMSVSVEPLEPGPAMAAGKGLLLQVCREHPREVERLWRRGGEG